MCCSGQRDHRLLCHHSASSGWIQLDLYAWTAAVYCGVHPHGSSLHLCSKYELGREGARDDHRTVFEDFLMQRVTHYGEIKV